MIPVHGSSNVVAAGWDFVSQALEPKEGPPLGVLTVEFTGGVQYEYEAVPYELYQRLIAARSAGKFLNERIEGNYQFRKVKDASNAGD